MDTNIINLTEIAAKHGVQEIVLPGWDTDTPLVCRAKRPSLYNMAATGNVPNPLLGVIQTLFSRNVPEIDKIPIKEQAQGMIQMAKYALVEPTYDQITEAGLALTDDQLMQIYVYAIGGAAMLSPFRQLLCSGADAPVDAVQDAPEPTGGD